MTSVMFVKIAALVALGAGVFTQVKPQTPMDVGPGRVAWFDITTTDLTRAKEFYGKMFDWTFTAVAGTTQAVQITSRGVGIGTIRGADGAISGYNGVIYVQVEDVQAASNKAKALGGKLVDGFPFNLPNSTGAIAVIMDPSGHPLGLYSRTPLPAKVP